MCLHPGAMQGIVWRLFQPHPCDRWKIMLRRLGFFLLASSAFAAVPLASADAQYYRAAPEPYYRAAPPPGAYQDERLPAPGYMTDEDDDDAPIVPRRRPQFTQNPLPPLD